ncbi:cytosine deaminase [Leptolyngbya sp. O-77]|uniref:cytosine deaminase n=1 Tax=Leptolyngbya sp. O-77 TaxID=1080068 RepID=UPI00074D3BC8|nr:cytosine deaminase [Leptolyngbya sp. O-77]BAU41636.1 Cytosine deaminase [Leptolyngbya sp. O-77]
MPHLDFARLNEPHYWLCNAHVPRPLLPDSLVLPKTAGILAQDNLARVDLEILDGAIRGIRPSANAAGEAGGEPVPTVDLKGGMVWAGLVDLHTHLDKGHVWGRSPNYSATFEDALEIIRADASKHWDAEDVYRRLEFGLKCSYAHGTTAIRTHIDSFGDQAAVSWSVFNALQQDWVDRLTLEAVSLVTLDYYCTPEGEILADLVAEMGGILGGVTMMGPDLEAQLDRLFTLAIDRGLDIDLHTDESGDPNDITLRYVAEAALRHDFRGQIVCGHCCSLAVQSDDEAQKTIDLVKAARIGVVSLPMCNLYLQDRNQRSALRGQAAASSPPCAHPPALRQAPTRTPRWRGITLLHELKHAGVPVAIASDNCRDPFYGFGDHDGLEVFTQGVRIAQLDAPYGDWSRVVTTTPADLMGLPDAGRIAPGLPADLILCTARYFSELLARPQGDRTVLRQGKPIDTTLPDYAELDDLLLK